MMVLYIYILGHHLNNKIDSVGSSVSAGNIAKVLTANKKKID